MSARVSICMPTHNGAEFLSEAIDSALRQTWGDFELLVCDDGSNDATVAIAEEAARRDSRVRVLNNEKTNGSGANWNYCLKHASGEFVQFLFQDDVMEPESIELKLRAMESDKNIHLSFSASRVIDENGKVTMSRRPMKGTQIIGGNELAKKSFLSKNLFGEPSNVMFRRDLVDDVGYFNERLRYNIDWEYWIRLSIDGKVAYVDEFLSHFRVSSNSTTSTLYREEQDALRVDQELFIASVAQLPQIAITEKDIKRHMSAMARRGFARKVYFALRRY